MKDNRCKTKKQALKYGLQFIPQDKKDQRDNRNNNQQRR